MMTFLRAFVVTIGLIVASDAFAQSFSDVDVDGAKKLIAAQDVVVLDVRTPEEFREGHIKNAVLANVNDPSFESKISAIAKGKKVLVYCAAGRRSVTASKIMVERGWKKVTNMKGGFNAWSAAGYPSVKGEK